MAWDHCSEEFYTDPPEPTSKSFRESVEGFVANVHDRKPCNLVELLRFAVGKKGLYHHLLIVTGLIILDLAKFFPIVAAQGISEIS